ncbi:MAG: GNAT family N-acetyltransferase [Bacteroidales bacterium]|nr:GNAT family N-acetyltransferase [Bacteroidales bacterium]
MKIKLLKATIDDLPFLEKVEKECFPDFQQTSRRMLRLSLNSPIQVMLICKIKTRNSWQNAGTLVLYSYKRSLRIYSIAVLPEFRGMRLGAEMMNRCIDHAKDNGFDKITLEAWAEDEKLTDWYENFGFVHSALLRDYYAPGKDAVKMDLLLAKKKIKRSRENLLVIDQKNSFKSNIENVKVVTARHYITDKKYQELKNARVFNLCNSYKYQSLGYYVSLLASARDHRVIPSVATIGDYRNISIVKSLSTEVDDLLQKSLNGMPDDKFELVIYFGRCVEEKYKPLAAKLYKLFETPALRINLTRSDKWYIQKVTPLGIDKINNGEREILAAMMQDYFSRKRFTIPRLKNYKYDLAILTNPNEQYPPSSARALEKFKAAADRQGFYVEFINKDDLNRLSEFDALLIRETTNVNNYTYSFSRMAYAEGLVVIDEPWSILRCSNKIYLYERMALNKIRMPASAVISRESATRLKTDSLRFPMVLKAPDGSFSTGVKKVNDREQLMSELKALFKTSDLIIAQSFIPTDYDWRIGILGNEPLFACKYFMARGHWQIYNWEGKKNDREGNFEAVPLHLVPEKVMKTALKAASLIGDGLYGVDLKEVNGEVFLIEVNDNPNIDAGIEDKLLGDELYNRIILTLFDRIETSRNTSKFIAADPM